MELLNTSDPELQRDNEYSFLEADAQKASLDPEKYLLNLTKAAICVFDVAMETLAVDLEESPELEPEFISLKRSFERLQKCKVGYTMTDESSGNRFNVRPQLKRLWKEQKYRALRQVLIAVMSRRFNPVVWTDTSLSALQMSRQYIEIWANGGYSTMHQLIRDFPSTEHPLPRRDNISQISEVLISSTLYLMELQNAGYSNREAEVSYLRIHRELFEGGEWVYLEPAKRTSLLHQMGTAYAASEKLRDALEELDLHTQRVQALSTTEDCISTSGSREAYLMKLLGSAPSQDGDATNIACPSTCASITPSPTS